MLRATGSHAAHLVMEALVGLAALVGIAGCVLAWRLGQGPIDVTDFVRAHLDRLPAAGARLDVGHAELAWEGFQSPGSPLDIRWRDLRVAAVDGTALATVPAGRVTLSMGRLVTGAIVPRDVELDRPALALDRRADGSLVLDLPVHAPAGGAAADPSALLNALTKPTGEGGAMPLLSQLHRLRIRDASFTLNDASLGATWQVSAPLIDLERLNTGGVTGTGTLALRMGSAAATLRIKAALGETGTSLEVTSTPLRPALLAGVAPVFAPLAALDAPVQATLTAMLDRSLAVRQATLALGVSAGTVHAGGGQVALESAGARLTYDGSGVHLDGLRVVQRTVPGAKIAAPVLTGSADASRGPQGWQASFAMNMDRAAFADLGAYWPVGTGGGARPWVVENITSGTASNAQVTGSVRAAADLSGVTLTGLAGGLDGTDMTLHWLRPVPPLEHATAHLTIDGPDVLHIDMPHAMQGPLTLSAGRVVINGLSKKDQFGDITVSADGGLAPLLALLNHPRMRLLSRRPIPLNDPAGQVQARLRVTLPLDARVTFNDIGISATAKMQGVHLGAIAAGRDLTGAELDLAVNTDALKITGSGLVGGVPASLGVDMDFRVGPPDQVLEHYTAHGMPTAAQLTAAGLPWVTGGSAVLDVDYASRRDGTGDLGLNADFTGTALATPFGWQKAQGDAAGAAARLHLKGSDIDLVTFLRANGPGLRLAGHGDMPRGQAHRLVLDRVQLGRTDAAGSVTLPFAAAPLSVTLRGPMLDLSGLLKQRASQPAAADDADDKPGEPWAVDLNFASVVLAKDETLSPLSVTAASDGQRILHADLTAGARREIVVRLQPVPGGRRLTADSDDAGAVLLAAGVADNMRGGTLRLDAKFDDTVPHSPLAGTATLTNFRVIDAPAIGRLLKAMTLYGATDLLRGPGLGFSKAVVPFHWQQRVLRLDSARAFSASLGLTAQGDIDLRRHEAHLQGTIVPAYFFNQLLGRIPIAGKLFSPETGGGVFAARYTVRGKLADPQIGVNPLSALTPGFLRGVFGLL